MYVSNKQSEALISPTSSFRDVLRKRGRGQLGVFVTVVSNPEEAEDPKLDEEEPTQKRALGESKQNPIY